MNESLINIGDEIKNYRNKAGLSQKELSLLCGVESKKLSRIESGEVTGVTNLTIEKIYASLGRKFIPLQNEKYDIKPFVKWAGGKSQLLEVIIKHLPYKFNNYFEPFIGGGALLFKLQPNSFHINDMNSELISSYECFKDDTLFTSLKKELENHENNHSEKYFYEIRSLDQKDDFLALPKYVHAGRMIYLNKSCFNGLYRVNSKGYYNVPFGKKEKVICYDRKNFESLRKYFKNTRSIISNCDFEEATKEAKKGDFVYFDPPYDTWDNKDSFTSYDKNVFRKKEQIRLYNLFKKLSSKGVYVMLSNHNTSFIRDLYKDFYINIIPAKRMINSKKDGRGPVEEVLITNYE